MKFKSLVILAILTFCVYSVADSHSGRTNSSGCHNVTATGGYHCHGGGSSSSGSRSSSAGWEQDEGLIWVGGVIVLVVVCWAIIDQDSCLLFNPTHNPDAAHLYFDQLPMQTPVNTDMLPRLDLTRQEHSGWRFQASYTFRF